MLKQYKYQYTYLLYGFGAGLGLIAVFVLGVIFSPAIRTRFGQVAVSNQLNTTQEVSSNLAVQTDDSALVEAVIPARGFTLPVTWGDLGKKLVEKGVIDQDQFVALYSERSGFGPAEQ